MSLKPTICVLILTGPYKNHKFYVKSDAPILIGRLNDAVIKIDYDELCSRKHAVIFLDKEECVIEDIGSTNGTFLNDVRINGKVKLENKDIVRVGSTNMQVIIGKAQEKAADDNLRKEHALIKKGVLIGGFLEVVDIHEGGMGIVYVCLDRRNSNLVALKTFKKELFMSESQQGIFKKEAQAWIRLGNHPHIVRAISVENFELRMYIVLEYIYFTKDGKNTLRHYLGCLKLSEILKFSIQFCDGMEYAYSNGIVVHRDIKPDNIMVEGGEVIKITDFGIAKLIQGLDEITDDHGVDLSQEMGVFKSRTGNVCGTLPYMAPEQFDGRVDKRSDIYAFGVVLFQMVTGGKLPFIGESHESYAMAHKNGKLQNVDSPLFTIISKCLEKNPDNRYQNFLDIREALNNILTQEGYEKVGVLVSSDLDYRDLTNKGNALDSLGQHEEAIKNYEKALELNPGYASAWVNKGVALGQLGKFNEGLRCFDKAIEINPIKSEFWYMKSQLLIKMKNYSEGLKCLDKALAINPSYAFALDDKGMVLGNMGKLHDAIICYDKSLKINPRNALAWFAKGKILVDLENLLEAISCIDKALEINSEYIQNKFPDVWLLKGSLLGNAGKLEEAIVCFDRAIKYSDDINAYLAKGEVLQLLKRYDEAIFCYDKVIGKNTKSIEGWYQKGVVLHSLGKLTDSLECLNKALELDPEDIEKWNDKGFMLINLEKFNEAMLCLEHSLKINCDNARTWFLKSIVLLALTESLSKENRAASYKKALQCVEEGLRLDPNDESAKDIKNEILKGLKNS